MCFNFLTETTTWIGRVSYRGATRSPVGNTLVFVGFLCWKLDIKNLGKCVQNVLLCRYAAKSKQTQIMCSVGKGWVKPGKSSSQCSDGAGGSEGSTLSPAQPTAQGLGCSGHTGGSAGRYLRGQGQQALRGMGCSARERPVLHYTENCYSLC